MSSLIPKPIKELFRPSVAGVLNAFTKAQARLEKIHARERERSARLQIEAAAASQEAFRARNVAQKLASLVS